MEFLTPIKKEPQIIAATSASIAGSAIPILREGPSERDNIRYKAKTNPRLHPPPTVITNVECQSLGNSFAPDLPAKKGMMIRESGMPIGKKSRKTNPKAIVLTAELRAE